VKRHVILVGLPGAGKTTAGRRALELLSGICPEFSDIDEQVESETGRSIARIFQESGEAEFRRLERAVMDRILTGPPQLVAAGGGWIVQPGNLEAARERGAAIVYLRVGPGDAANRLGDDATRPLLAGRNREATLAALLREREASYLLADRSIEGVGTPEDVAQRLAGVVEELASS
jgi:shikimate kinase